MKAPTKVIFVFDPEQSNIPVLSDFKGRILWACIRYQHIVSQHFNGNVQDVVLQIAEKKPTKYEDFKAIIQASGLRIFGTIWKTKSGYAVLDDEFWQGVWEYLTGKKTLIIEQSQENDK
jgi:hypothetical protein